MKKIFTLMAIAAFTAACLGNANKPAEATEETEVIEVVTPEACTCPEEGKECTCEGECTCEKTAETAPATEVPAETPAK
jgi:hypothetical protein